MPTVLKTDARLLTFRDDERSLLADLDLDLIERHCETEEELIEHGQGADALMVIAEPVTARVIDALDDCRVIARFGAGLDNVDLEAATRRGVQVTFVPGASVEEVSDHAIAMLLSLARHLPDLDASVRRGEWKIPAELPTFRRLRDQTLGVVGAGRIGQAVVLKARGVGLKVIVHDPFADPDRLRQLGVEKVELDELLVRSDHVSIHAPLTAASHHLFGRREFELMKPTAYLINVARGGLVDQAALVAALVDGQIAGAGIDVQEVEPPASDEPLLSLPNVILSPHAAHHSKESMDDLCRTAITDVAAVLAGRPPAHPANQVAA
jgi:D-3-phosphoglycerate dehydrogenase